jgi:hypothetical protein
MSIHVLDFATDKLPEKRVNRTSAGLSGHEVGQSRWSFDQGISILLWNNLSRINSEKSLL